MCRAAFVNDVSDRETSDSPMAASLLVDYGICSGWRADRVSRKRSGHSQSAVAAPGRTRRERCEYRDGADGYDNADTVDPC